MIEEEIQQLLIELNGTECQCDYLEEKGNTRVTLVLPTTTTTTTTIRTIRRRIRRRRRRRRREKWRHCTWFTNPIFRFG